MGLRLAVRVVYRWAPRVVRGVHPDTERVQHAGGIGPAGPLDAVVADRRGIEERRIVRLPPVGGHGVAAVHVARESVRGKVGVQANLVPAAPPAVDGARRDGEVAGQVEAHPGAVALGGVQQRSVRAGGADVAVRGREHDRLVGAREIPQARQRQTVGEQGVDDPDEQPHVDVGVRDVDPLQVDPLIEDVTGPVLRQAIAVETSVERIALAHVGDASGQVERPRRGTPGPGPDHGRVSRG